MRVLVVYATACGSTRGIAERIGECLRTEGVTVDCLPVQADLDVAAYDAVVVGSAIHGRAWMPKAVEFMHANAAVLSSRPVWVFSVGMVDALPRPVRRWGRQEGPMALAKLGCPVQWRGARLFSGVVAPSQLPLTGRIVLRLMGGRYGDFRDWEGVRTWATEIAASLQGEGGPAARSAPGAGRVSRSGGDG